MPAGPLAMASALKSGNLGVMDLYRMKNLESDTQMRRSIAGGDAPAAGTQES